MQQSDAEQAYTQAELGTPRRKSVDRGDASENTATDAWVSLPPELVPAAHRHQDRNPVYPLRLALYGHPDAGGYWERHCNRAAQECGFEAVEGLPSTFFQPKHRTLLMVYVDDFKMSGGIRAALGSFEETQAGRPQARQ